MLWVLLLCLAVVLGSLVVLGVASYGTYRRVRGLTAEVGAAGDRVNVASADLNEGLAVLQQAAPGGPGGGSPGGRGPAGHAPRTGRTSGPTSADGARLAARVHDDRLGRAGR